MTPAVSEPAEFFFRTEDIRPEDIGEYFVETEKDRSIINFLKSRLPVVLEGSRGVGKSFLLRIAESEQLSEFGASRVLPVYVSFNKSSLIHTSNPTQFHYWMLARICSRIIRTLTMQGLAISNLRSAGLLAGGQIPPDAVERTRVDSIVDQFEESWAHDNSIVDVGALPSVDQFKDAIEDICRALTVDRINLLIDEAAHIFLPQQQREFFTLFRDLRSPFLTCNAAIYPGITSFGPTFQPIHDATVVTLDRDVLDSEYTEYMREIVTKQANSSSVDRTIELNKDNFKLLAYAASGNPRILLKTFVRASRLTGTQVFEVIRSYYRTDIWAEHSNLTERYPGHRELIDWGRRFIESVLLPDLKSKNEQYLLNSQSTCFFWIHRDAPQCVKESLRLLAYTGIVREYGQGMKASRSEIGTRYFTNLGCLFALEPAPTKTGLEVAKSLYPKRMVEFGFNHQEFQNLIQNVPDFSELEASDILDMQLEKNVDVLDVTQWQREKLRSLNLNTIGAVLRASESSLQQAHYVGEKRARRMRNAALAAVYEYLSG